MILAVLDANVLAARIVGALTATSTPGELFRRWGSGVFELVLLEYILDEAASALSEPYFQARRSQMEIDAYLNRFRTEARVVPITAAAVGVASHYHDAPVIATAVSAGAAYLVTGDKELRAVGGYGGVTFLTPREFLDLLDRGGDANG